MLIRILLKSAVIATTNYLTLLAISPPHFASEEQGDRLVRDTTSPERLITKDRTHWLEKVAVAVLTAHEVWNVRKGWNSVGAWSARSGELGIALTLLGAVLRLRCYQILGRFFTFKVAIRREHRLVKGPFPYDVIRHPSYTGLMVIAFGVIVRVVSPANALHFPYIHQLQKQVANFAHQWLVITTDIRQSPDTIGYVAIVAFVGIALAGQLRLIDARVRVEEKALREEFEAEYDRYCGQTWKYFPGW